MTPDERLLARCLCGHGSDCHAASDDGIHECQDCDCRSFHWDGGNRIPPDKDKRDWITGRKLRSDGRRVERSQPR